MSALAARLPGSRVAAAGGHPARAPAARWLAFAGVAAFAVGHWALLLERPPTGDLAATLAVAAGLGGVLTWLGQAGWRAPARHGGAALATLAALALALVVAGLPSGLLEPTRWDELASGVDRGLAGVQGASWPYDGPDEWVRLVILLAVPAALIAAAAFTFWPVRRGAGALRSAGLVSLLLLYGTAVAEYDPGEPLLRGAILLLLIGSWLWLPVLRGRDAAPAAVLLGAVLVLSLPLAARLDADAAVIDYEAWDWFGGKDVTFDWNHSYGPLDWPRDGTTLLNIEADRPHYWKAETLDRFDGRRWVRSDRADRTRPFDELPPRPNRAWDDRIRVTVRALRTDFVVGAGTPYLVTGAGDALTGSADGTVRRLDEPLRRGDSYTVRTYDPDPSARQMRAAPDVYTPALGEYTALTLPVLSSGARDPVRRLGEQVSVGIRGGALTGTPGAARRLAASPYRRTFALARRLTAGAPGAYEAARRVERHLEAGYSYSERPPARRYALEAFLFRDREGYCQQFSGAMALMLRMVGIPARVVSGFSPGSFNRDSGEYRVRDLDAHSWVEVYLGGIGWVTFDPTPPAAPADRPGGEAGSSGPSGDSAGSISSSSGPGSDRRDSLVPSADSPGGAGGGIPLVAVLAAAAAVLGAAAAALIYARRRALAPVAVAEASLRELERALPRLGWDVRPATTLLDLERRLRRAAGPRAAAYVAALRAGRFGTAAAGAPGPSERRALRRELTAGGGVRVRIRGLLALPPAGPFTRA